MEQISAEIFRMYDIRGVYEKDLTDKAAYLIGKGVGTFILGKNVKKIAVGRDNRVSGGQVSQNFIKGLLDTGCDVVNFGFVLNPLIYFSWYHLDFNAGAVVTASHNPPEYNGFKISVNKRPLLGDDYQKIKDICQSGNFKSGSGTVYKGNIWPDYKKNILSSISLRRKLKIAVDCGNGTAGMFAPEILKDLGCEVTPIFCESDGTFPNHIPYPQKTEYYTKLIRKIKELNLDAGLAFDGDGDRLGIYDEKGNFIENDRLAMIFASSICKNYPNTKIVMNVSTSLSVIDYIKSCGGEFYFSKTGYPYISARMKELGSIFGGEISGHFFFKDKYYGYDDALYAGIRILEILSSGESSLSTIVSKLPKYFETREFRLEIPENADKFKIINDIKKEIMAEYPEVKVLDLDGIRFTLPLSWGLIRVSNTEPLLTGRAEGKTAEELKKIETIIKEKLKKYNVILDWETVK